MMNNSEVSGKKIRLIIICRRKFESQKDESCDTISEYSPQKIRCFSIKKIQYIRNIEFD